MKVVEFLKGVVKWLAAILAGSIGIVEVALKFVKEVLTLIVDILFPIIPIAKFQAFVTGLRTIINKIYDWFSANKEKILKWLGVIDG
jgi:hypothetical protein